MPRIKQLKTIVCIIKCIRIAFNCPLRLKTSYIMMSILRMQILTHLKSCKMNKQYSMNQTKKRIELFFIKWLDHGGEKKKKRQNSSWKKSMLFEINFIWKSQSCTTEYINWKQSTKSKWLVHQFSAMSQVVQKKDKVNNDNCF